MTDYEPWSFQWTWVNGEFLEINLNGPRNDGDPPTTTTLQFCAVLSDTSYEDFVAGQRLVLDEFPLTVYDLDGSFVDGKEMMETVKFKDYDSLHAGSSILVGAEGDLTTFTSTVAGTG